MQAYFKEIKEKEEQSAKAKIMDSYFKFRVSGTLKFHFRRESR